MQNGIELNNDSYLSHEIKEDIMNAVITYDEIDHLPSYRLFTNSSQYYVYFSNVYYTQKTGVNVNKNVNDTNSCIEYNTTINSTIFVENENIGQYIHNYLATKSYFETELTSHLAQMFNDTTINVIVDTNSIFLWVVAGRAEPKRRTDFSVVFEEVDHELGDSAYLTSIGICVFSIFATGLAIGWTSLLSTGYPLCMYNVYTYIYTISLSFLKKKRWVQPTLGMFVQCLQCIGKYRGWRWVFEFWNTMMSIVFVNIVLKIRDVTESLANGNSELVNASETFLTMASVMTVCLIMQFVQAPCIVFALEADCLYPWPCHLRKDGKCCVPAKDGDDSCCFRTRCLINNVSLNYIKYHVLGISLMAFITHSPAAAIEFYSSKLKNPFALIMSVGNKCNSCTVSPRRQFLFDSGLNTFELNKIRHRLYKIDMICNYIPIMGFSYYYLHLLSVEYNFGEWSSCCVLIGLGCMFTNALCLWLSIFYYCNWRRRNMGAVGMNRYEIRLKLDETHDWDDWNTFLVKYHACKPIKIQQSIARIFGLQLNDIEVCNVFPSRFLDRYYDERKHKGFVTIRFSVTSNDQIFDIMVEMDKQNADNCKEWNDLLLDMKTCFELKMTPTVELFSLEYHAETRMHVDHYDHYDHAPQINVNVNQRSDCES